MFDHFISSIQLQCSHNFRFYHLQLWSLDFVDLVIISRWFIDLLHSILVQNGKGFLLGITFPFQVCQCFILIDGLPMTTILEQFVEIEPYHRIFSWFFDLLFLFHDHIILLSHLPIISIFKFSLAEPICNSFVLISLFLNSHVVDE